MEKRVYELSQRRSLRLVAATGIMCAVFVVFGVWMCWRSHGHWWLMTNAWVLLWCWLSLAFPRISTLQISDEGLFLTVRRGVGYRLRWDAIASVRLHEQSTAAEHWSVIIEDSQGHVVKVPRKCRDSAEIIDILKQNLPESVFQAW